ncbi:hypothetical protein JCM9534A_15210 [Catenuloplanes indicus JCM 9534]
MGHRTELQERGRACYYGVPAGPVQITGADSGDPDRERARAPPTRPVHFVVKPFVRKLQARPATLAA